jgi:quercetin dioxygenase-like cupin family protein
VGVVLYSDGFTFKQSGKKIPLRAGDWFLFDDGVEHEVVETRESTSLIILTVPCRPLEHGAGAHAVAAR